MAQRSAKVRRVKGAIDPGKPGKARYRTIVKDGETVRLRVIDAESTSFAAEFLSAFRSNVRKARKENRQLPDAP